MPGKKEWAPVDPLLDKPRILLPEPSFSAQFSFYAAFLLIGGLGALGCFFTAFSVPVQAAVLCVAGLFHALVCCLMFLWKRWGWIFSLACGVLWLSALLLFFGDWVRGCARVFNLVLEAYADKLNMALPQFAVGGAGPATVQRQSTIFVILLLFPFFWCFAWLLIRCRSSLGPFCLTGLFLLAPLAISIIPAVWALAALLLFWILLLLTAPTLGRRHKLLDEKGRFYASGLVMARPATLLLIPIAALFMALVYAVFPLKTYERPALVEELCQGALDGFGVSGVLRGGMGSGNNLVALDALGSREYTGETVLRVKYDWQKPAGAETPGKDFLKSFAGSVYTGTQWERLPAGDVQELQALLEGDLPQTILSRLSEFLPRPGYNAESSYTLSVENVSGNPRCAFLPYGLKSADFESLGLEPAADGFFKASSWIAGAREYSVAALGLPAYFLQDPVLMAAYNGYSICFMDSLFYRTVMGAMGNDAKLLQAIAEAAGQPSAANPEETLSQILFDLLEIREYYSQPGSIEQEDRWRAPERVQPLFSQEAWRYLKNLEDYTQFVYDHYTQLPEGTEAFLEEFRKERGLSWDGADLFQYLEQIRSILWEDHPYSLNPPPVPEGEDFAAYFLSGKQPGYCVHFATAATLLLRSAGIPARYAEGYAVPASRSGWVNVPDYNAHAWTEVYLEGYGWIPVEVTPPSPDSPAAYPTATVEETPAGPSSSASSTAGEPQETSQPEQASGPEPVSAPSRQEAGQAPAPGGQNNSSSEGFPWLVWLLAAAAAVLLLLLLILANRFARIRARRKKWSGPDRNQAALCAYAYLTQLCKQGEGLMRPRPGIPQELEDLALKAKFSQHTLTPQELDQFFEGIDRLQELLIDRLPRIDYLRCKYLLALF